MSESTEKRCRWANGERLLPTHLRGCNSAGCEGCRPCEDDHCVMPRCNNHLREHEPYVCTRCVGKVRTKLERIRDLCIVAPVVTVEGRLDSAVAVLVGPVPERSTHTARRAWAMGGGLCRCVNCPDWETIAGPACNATACGHETCERIHGKRVCPELAAWLDNADDERHPLWVLGSWDMLVAEHLDHTRTMRVTVGSAVGYLTANLTDLARHEDFAFDEMAREVSACVEHIENVLAISPYVQRGAPCPVCQKAGRKAKPLVHEFDEDDLTSKGDLWACPSADCGETWEPEEYRKYVSGEYVDHADRLTASQMAKRFRLAESTVRRWANEKPPRVRKRGYNGQRQQLYDVSDVEALRATPEAC